MRFPIDNFSPKPFPAGCVNQYYGENPELYTITKSHSGWDIIPNDGRVAYGLPVFAMYDCVVVELDDEKTSGYGNAVRTMRADGLINIYGHLSYRVVERGQALKAGDRIGSMGNSGFVVSGSTPFWKSNPTAGTHLHVTFIPTTPVQAGDHGAAYTYPGFPPFRYTYANNGNLGAVNPAPYFAQLEGTFISLPWDLQRGDHGPDLMNLQRVLWMEGLFDEADIIGIYGPKTQAAVFAYQRRYNLVSAFNVYRGRYCGPATRAQIMEMYAPWAPL